VTNRSPGATSGAPATEAKPDQAAVARETAPEKSDGSELTARQPAAALPAAAAATGAGLLGVDVVVSQVSCAGAQIVQAAAARPPALPHTGANGHLTRDLGVAGLGLILSGASAVGLVRRRRVPAGG
jgi:hypothetical protein